MSFLTYKAIHLSGIFAIITILAGVSVDSLRGGRPADSRYSMPIRIGHVLALLLVLIGGFGMLARMGVLASGLPNWAALKLGIWVSAGAAGLLSYRGDRAAVAVLCAVPIVAMLAGAVALFKPF